MHFSLEPSNVEFLYRSASQLSICGAVANWCDELTQQILGHSFLSKEKSVANVNDQLCHKLEPREMDTLVQTPRTNVQAAGDRLRIHPERFEELSSEINEATGGVKNTAHRAHLTRATHGIFLVCTWLTFWSPTLDRNVVLWFCLS